MDTLKLKKDAKEKLKGNYIEIVSAMIIIYSMIILILAVYNVSKNATLMIGTGIFLSSFVIMGFITMLLKVSKGEKTSLEDFFSKIYWCVKTLLLTLVLSIIIGLFLFFLGVSLYGLYTSSGLWGICDALVVDILICIGIIISTALLVFTSYITLSFSMSYFLFHDHPELSVFEILKKSYNLMEGHKLELFILLISFVGYILLGILTFGILYLWLIPYMGVSISNFYRELLPKRGRPKKM